MKRIALYLKLRETHLSELRRWNGLLRQIHRRAREQITIYCWIESKRPPAELIKRNPYGVRFITHANKREFDPRIAAHERAFARFMKDVGFNAQRGAGQAHLKSFLLPEEEIIYNVDADDMFYDFLTPEILLRGAAYLEEKKLDIITRPYWIMIEHGFSFGFTLQRKHMPQQMHIFEPGKIEERFKGDMMLHYQYGPIANLDIHFHNMLIHGQQRDPRELFFAFKESPCWEALNPKEIWANHETTRRFMRLHQIPVI